jgi:hypothetical protein
MKERRVRGDLLGLTPPWRVRDVEYALDEGEVRIFVEVQARAKLRCPSCERECAGYDARGAPLAAPGHDAVPHDRDRAGMDAPATDVPFRRNDAEIVD